MRGVIYARYSSDNQREESIEGQIRENTAFARKNGIDIVATYIDRAYSAKTDNRPEFQRMLKMCEQKQIDLIITKSISRFARNTMEALEIVRRLKILGIAVQFEKEGIYTLSLGDEMLLNTFTAISQNCNGVFPAKHTVRICRECRV